MEASLALSRRGLAVLAVLLLAALGTLFWLDRPSAPGNGEAGKDRERLLTLAREKVRRIELARGNTRVALEKTGARRWRMTAPVDSEADAEQVDRLLDAVAGARISRVVEEKPGDEAPFGLAPPEAELRLESEGGGPPAPLRLGRLSPVGFERYASVGDGRVVLVDGSVGTALLRDPEDFRQKRLIPVDAEHVRRIALVRDGERIVVEREGADWKVREPVRDLGDAMSCDSLARSLARLALARLVEPDKMGEILPAFADPVFDAQVSTEPEGTFRIQVAAEAKSGGERPARRVGSTVAGWIRASDLQDLMERKARDLREKRLVLASAAEILQVRIERAGRTLTVKREREGEPWQVEEAGTSGPADGGKVEDLLDRLRWIRATPEDGRAAPDWEMSLQFAGASGALGRLDIGPEFEDRGEGDAGKKRLARSSWRPGFLFSFPSESLGTVPTGRADLAPAQSAAGAGQSP